MQKCYSRDTYDYFFCLKRVLDCNNSIYEQNRVCDVRLMKNIVKKQHVKGLVSLFPNGLFFDVYFDR